jgi:hypothetical protein
LPGSLGTDEQPECRPEAGSGRIEGGASYRGATTVSAAVPTHADPMPRVMSPAFVARIQWHVPSGPWTAAAQVSAVEATETILDVVEGPSTNR